MMDDFDLDDEDSNEELRDQRVRKAYGVVYDTDPCDEGGSHECDEEGTCYGCVRRVVRKP